MNTKTLLLLGALGAAGMTSAVAQTNVYSVNAVGYVNKTIPTGFSLISNPLNAPTNSVANVIKGAPDNTTVFKWTGSTFVGLTYSVGDGGWIDNNLNLADLPLAPGEGVFIAPPSSFTLTFVGDVPQGNLTNSLPAGFSIRSSIVPQSGGIASVLGFAPAVNDIVFRYSAGYITSTYVGGGNWEDSNLNPTTEPVLAVGESVFISKNAPGLWVRSFSVNN